MRKTGLVRERGGHVIRVGLQAWQGSFGVLFDVNTKLTASARQTFHASC